MWWGAAHIVNACGLGLLTSHGTAPDFVTNDLANALVLLGYGLTWTGARVFDGRNVQPLHILLAPIVSLAGRIVTERRGSERVPQPANCEAANPVAAIFTTRIFRCFFRKAAAVSTDSAKAE